MFDDMNLPAQHVEIGAGKIEQKWKAAKDVVQEICGCFLCYMYVYLDLPDM